MEYRLTIMEECSTDSHSPCRECIVHTATSELRTDYGKRLVNGLEAVSMRLAFNVAGLKGPRRTPVGYHKDPDLAIHGQEMMDWRPADSTQTSSILPTPWRISHSPCQTTERGLLPPAVNVFDISKFPQQVWRIAPCPHDLPNN